MAGMAKEMKKADGAWMFDHAMPPITRHTARSHREPHGWYVDTRKALLGATATATKADVHLHQVRRDVAAATRRAGGGEEAVETALKGRVGSTLDHKWALEDSYGMLQEELRRLETVQGLLDAEAATCQRRLQVNRERRKTRLERPELLHDYAFKLLDAQAAILQGSVEKYVAQRAEAGWYVALLERMTAMVVADAHDKGHAVAVDDTLKEGKEGDFNIQLSEFSSMVRQPLHDDDLVRLSDRHVFTWSAASKGTVLHAKMLQAESAAMRRATAHLIQLRRRGEQRQHDLVQGALQRGLASLAALCDELRLQLRDVEEAIGRMHTAKAELEAGLAALAAPLAMAQRRSEARRSRPAREAVNDEVESALRLQASQSRRAATHLTMQLDQTNATLASLVAQQAALSDNLAGKQAHLETDRAVDAAAASRPATPELSPHATVAIYDDADPLPSAKLLDAPSYPNLDGSAPEVAVVAAAPAPPPAPAEKVDELDSEETESPAAVEEDASTPAEAEAASEE